MIEGFDGTLGIGRSGKTAVAVRKSQRTRGGWNCGKTCPKDMSGGEHKGEAGRGPRV
jgi:hypothetical protein